MTRVVVLGDGAWGTALALTLDRAGHKVTIWGKFPEYVRKVEATRENSLFLPGIKIPRSISLVSGLDGELAQTDAYIAAIPTQFMRDTFADLRSALDRRAPLICVSKGIEMKTLQRPSEILTEVLGRVRIGVLSGPSHAPEVARGLPASIVVASRQAAVARRAQAILAGNVLRVYTSDDLIGVELGGALKNVIALAAGICEGLGLGHNAKAALLSRGIVEMARLGAAMGARKWTFFGLSGIGDLITTTTYPHGRNLTVGRAIGEGKKLADVLKGMSSVAEGVWTAKAVRRLSRRYRVEMPISCEIYRVLFHGKAPRAAVRDLMGRGPKSESEDLS